MFRRTQVIHGRHPTLVYPSPGDVDCPMIFPCELEPNPAQEMLMFALEYSHKNRIAAD